MEMNNSEYKIHKLPKDLEKTALYLLENGYKLIDASTNLIFRKKQGELYNTIILDYLEYAAECYVSSDETMRYCVSRKILCDIIFDRLLFDMVNEDLVKRFHQTKKQLVYNDE